MDFSVLKMILVFVGILIIFGGGTVFLIRVLMFASTEKAKERLDQEIAQASEKQADLSKKLKEADEELEKRQSEAKDTIGKLRVDAEEETKSERDKIINEARTEGEEIIAKAHIACEKMQKELQRDFDMYIAECSLKILPEVMSQNAIGALDTILIDEFIEKINNLEMDQVGSDVAALEIISLNPLDKAMESKIESMLAEKLGRTIPLKCSVESGLGGGLILKFGTMALDGSLKNTIREVAIEKQEELAAQII